MLHPENPFEGTLPDHVNNNQYHIIYNHILLDGIENM